MHRSGTSLIANLLRDCGLFLGKSSEIMVDRSEDNLEGYSETIEILQFNDRLLNNFGGSWKDVPAFSENWQTDPSLSEFRNEAYKLSQKYALENGPWGWKDPRATLLIPFWRQVYPEAKVIFCVRNPIEIAVSLNKRVNYDKYPYGVDFESGISITDKYFDAMAEYLEDENSIFTHYDTWMENPYDELVRIAEFSEIIIDESRFKAIIDRVNLEYKRNNYSEELFNQIPEITLELSKKYIGLSKKSGRIFEGFSDSISKLPQSFLDFYSTIQTFNGRAYNRIIELYTSKEKLQRLNNEMTYQISDMSKYRLQIEKERNDYKNILHSINNLPLVKIQRLLSKLNIFKKGTFWYFAKPSFAINLLLSFISSSHKQKVRQYLNVYRNLFDANWYLAKNIDVQYLGIDPFYHYLKSGWKEGRNPNPLFDTKYYLEQNPDIEQVGINPLVHYGTYGWQEERNPHILFDVNWYLSKYPDVEEAGMEPLSHYLSIGYKEMREPTFWFKPEKYLESLSLSKDSLEINPFAHFVENCDDVYKYYNRNLIGEITKNTMLARINRNAQSILEYPKKSPDSVLTEGELKDLLLETLSQDEFHLSISHDNYLKVPGGIQNCISDEQSGYNKNGIGYLHLYPFNLKPTVLLENKEFYIAINCNEVELGVAQSHIFAHVLSDILKSKKMQNIYLHQLLGINLVWLNEIVNIQNNVKTYFWLHDYFSICPSYNLLRNGIEYCNAPDVGSNSCSICLYGDLRSAQLSALSKFFENNEINIITPANFTKEFWQKKTTLKYNEITVVPHGSLNFEQTNIVKTQVDSPLRIAFLGYPSYPKGWTTYRQLVSNFADDPRYSFYHLGNSGPKNYLPLEFIEVNVTGQNRTEMVDALKEHQIDVTFLWSVWPETYSYTLYESIGAGCFIISNALSGNIKDVVDSQKCGVIYQDEDQLIKVFEGTEFYNRAKKYFENGKKLVPFNLRQV